MLSVQIEVGTLTHPLKFDEKLFVCGFRYRKLLTVPHDGIGQVDYILSKCLIAIESIRQRHLGPSAAGTFCSLSQRHVAYRQLPFSVEV